MKTLKEITSSFKIDSADERACLTHNEAPKSFIELAQCMLAGHFLVTDGQEKVIVRPTVLEFYYHEEREDGIKDPIVYHKDTKSSKKPLILTGFLHNHVSGIDLAFEHENNGKVRASGRNDLSPQLVFTKCLKSLRLSCSLASDNVQAEALTMNS